MDDYYWELEIGKSDWLCIGTLSKTTFDEHEIDNCGNDFGYFLYEMNDKGIVVLAKFVSEEMASQFIHNYSHKLIKPKEPK